MIKVVIQFLRLAFTLISGTGIVLLLLGAFRFLIPKELGEKLKHSSLGNGLTGCYLIYFSAKMIQIISQDPRCGVRKELDQSPLVV